MLRHHHDVALPGLDVALATGAQVALPRRVGLHGRDDLGLEAAGGAHRADGTKGCVRSRIPSESSLPSGRT